MCLRPNSHITLKNMYVLGKISRHEISPKKIKQISSGASGVSVIDMIQVQGLLPDRYEAQVSGWVPQPSISWWGFGDFTIFVAISVNVEDLSIANIKVFCQEFSEGEMRLESVGNSIPNSCAWHLRTWITLAFYKQTSKKLFTSFHQVTKQMWLKMFVVGNSESNASLRFIEYLLWWIASPGIDLPFPSQQGSTHWNCKWAKKRWFITSGKKQHLWPTQVLESTSCDLTIFAWVQFQVTTATEKVD